jgi:hypothetical protein
VSRKPSRVAWKKATSKAKLSAESISIGEVGKAPTAMAPNAYASELLGLGEQGISGTANYAGRLYVEENQKLQWQLAFGTPGATRFGFWEHLERTNGYITAALESVAAPIRDATVQVKPADSPRIAAGDAQKHADFVRWNLLEALEPRWPTFLDQLVKRPLNYGFGLWEKVAAVVEHPLLPNGRGYALKKLAERLPVSIYENGWVEDAGELSIVKQRGPAAGGGKWVNVDLPVSKLLLHTWNRTGNNYAGFSVFRPVEYACRIMDHLLRMTGVGMVREAVGVPYAEALTDKTKRLTPRARERLWKQLANLVYHENAAMVMPRGWTLKWFVSAGRDKSSVIKAYHDLGKLILFQTKSQQLNLGLDDTGSRSVGEVHARGNEEFNQGVAAELGATLNGVGERKYTGLVKWLVDINFGPQKAYPTVEIVLKKRELEPKERAEAASTYVGAGIINPTLEDENVAREDLGFTPIDEATRNAAIARKAAAAPPAPPGAPPAPGAPPRAAPPAAPGGAIPPPPAPPPKLPPAPGKARGSAFVPSRALRPSEQAIDFAAIDNFLTRARDTFEMQARPLIAAMVVKALPSVRHAMDAGKPSTIGEMQLDTTDLAGFVTRFLTEARGFGYGQVQKEYSHGTTDKVLDERAAGDQKHAPVVRMAEGEEEDDKGKEASDDADEQLEQMQTHLVRRMRQRVTSDLEKAALDEYRTDGEADDVVRTVMSDLIDTGALKSDAGLVLTKAFNVGREEFAQEHGDEVDSVELSALLDGNQCDPCDQADGEEYEFNSPEHLEHVPPLKECDGGDRCRCMLAYNFKKDAGGSEDDGPDAEDDE